MRALPTICLLFSLACGHPAAVPASIPPAAADTKVAPADVEPDPERRSRGSAPTPDLDAITLPRRPDWTDKYFATGADQRRFEITAAMKRFGLTRAQAVEAQNHYRDLARSTPEADLDGLLAEAVTRARADRYEDRRDLAKLASARFVVVFDLDDTLYDQYLPKDTPETCHDLEVATEDGVRRIKLVPGWERAFRRIVELGGAVVLFSANVDDLTWANGRAWTLDGVPVTESELVAGFLTNSHLVQQHKREGFPVQEPSKDLRVVDETLRRAIIVDDNPSRIAQPANLRWFKKFHGREYCTSPDKAVRKAYAEALPRVVWEIEDSVRWMEAHPGTDFITAYRPFTTLGQVAATFVRDTLGLSPRKAVEWVRTHPDFVDDAF